MRIRRRKIDPDEDPTGDAGRPICGECARENYILVLDMADGVVDGDWDPGGVSLLRAAARDSWSVVVARRSPIPRLCAIGPTNDQATPADTVPRAERPKSVGVFIDCENTRQQIRGSHAAQWDDKLAKGFKPGASTCGRSITARKGSAFTAVTRAKDCNGPAALFRHVAVRWSAGVA